MIRSSDGGIFHEIKIAYFEFWSHDQFVSHKNNHEIEILNSIISKDAGFV